MFKLHRPGLDKNKAILAYLKEFNPSIKLTVNSITQLKNRSVKWKAVPRTKHCEKFVKSLLVKFEDFDEASFYKINASRNM